MHYILNKEKFTACYIADNIDILTRSFDWLYDDGLLSELLQLSGGIQSPHSEHFKTKFKFIKDFVSTIREEKSIEIVKVSGIPGNTSFFVCGRTKYRVFNYLMAAPIQEKKNLKAKKKVYTSSNSIWGSYENVASDGL